MLIVTLLANAAEPVAHAEKAAAKPASVLFSRLTMMRFAGDRDHSSCAGLLRVRQGAEMSAICALTVSISSRIAPPPVSRYVRHRGTARRTPPNDDIDERGGSTMTARIGIDDVFRAGKEHDIGGRRPQSRNVADAVGAPYIERPVSEELGNDLGRDVFDIHTIVLLDRLRHLASQLVQKRQALTNPPRRTRKEPRNPWKLGKVD